MFSSRSSTNYKNKQYFRNELWNENGKRPMSSCFLYANQINSLYTWLIYICTWLIIYHIYIISHVFMQCLCLCHQVISICRTIWTWVCSLRVMVALLPDKVMGMGEQWEQLKGQEQRVLIFLSEAMLFFRKVEHLSLRHQKSVKLRHQYIQNWPMKSAF